MNKILIVDGSNLLFQMFYGMPARITNREGRAIQGTLGFIGALLKMIRMVSPTHVAVLFDGECHNPRKDIDEEYKANRPDFSEMPEEETPFSQLPDIYAALDYMGIAHRETETCEADDWISGYANKYGQNNEVVVSSFDSDFFQLITENVTVLRYRGEKSVFCTPDYIWEKLGIEPCQYADFKSLTGDSADNIKGAEGIGPKTAAKLLRTFGSLDEIIVQFESIDKPSIRESVGKSRERLAKNYALVKLAPFENLPFSLGEMSFKDKGYKTTEILDKLGIR